MFNGQWNQDKYLEETIFKGYKNGFFIDIGAHDGRSINNTLYFETANNWTGINVEPIKSVYDKLVTNRPNCVNLNCAIDETQGQAEFICNVGYTEMLSGLKSHYHEKHNTRLQYENNITGSTTSIQIVDTNTLANIFDEFNVKHVNYLSIDVEGAEFSVIKSIDFDKVFIDVIEFENNYDDILPIIEYLVKKGYVLLHKSHDIFMINENSIFYIKNQ